MHSAFLAEKHSLSVNHATAEIFKTMKRLSLILMVVGLLLMGGQAFAELCAIDPVPAATLLVPYFEVDLGNTEGVTTIFTINNASAAPALAHVIFWTDWSAPTIDFDLYLTGYDVITVNVRDVFAGNIPLTADAPSDTDQGNTNCGGRSTCGKLGTGGFSANRHWDDTDPVLAGEQGFPNCTNFFPFINNPAIQNTALDRLVNGHTGQPVLTLGGGSDDCLGADHGDGFARGYITIDNVSSCSLVLNPDSSLPAYFADGGTGIVNNENQLWGDWFLVDFVNDFAQGNTLVHIEADDAFNADNGVLAPSVPPNPTNYTFYGRYRQDDGGDDNREPLGTVWGATYLNGGNFDQSQWIVWRDSTHNDTLDFGETCGNGFGAGPDWFPLNETEVICWDQMEDAVELCFFTGGLISPPDDDDPPCFPYETGRYDVGVDPLDPPFNFGWCALNLNIPDDSDADADDVDFPEIPPEDISQSYVLAVHSAFGRFSVGLEAIELSSACDNVNPVINGATVNGGTNAIPFF